MVDTRSHDRQLASDWSRIKGAPAEENFRLQEEDVPELRKGEILCRALYISVDPITRCMSTAATIYVCIMHICTLSTKLSKIFVMVNIWLKILHDLFSLD